MSFSNKQKNIKNIKNKNIKKNKTKKNVKMVGGGIDITMIPDYMIIQEVTIKKGDILIADSGFTSELSGRKEDTGKVFHDKGFAWDYNYGKNKKWIAVSKSNYQILLKEQDKKEKLKIEEEEYNEELQNAEEFERKNRISFIKSIMFKNKNPHIKIRTPELIITNPKKIYELIFNSKRDIKKLERTEIYELKINDLQKIGKIVSNGWFVNGYINKDHYSFITDFEAYNGNKWVIGNYNNIVYSSSKEDFNEFYKLFPEDTFDPADI